MAESVDLELAAEVSERQEDGTWEVVEQQVLANIANPDWVHSHPPGSPYLGLELPGAGPGGRRLRIVIYGPSLEAANLILSVPSEEVERVRCRTCGATSGPFWHHDGEWNCGCGGKVIVTGNPARSPARSDLPFPTQELLDQS